MNDDGPIPPDQLQAILARALASDHAVEPASPPEPATSYARVLCPDVFVADLRLDEGRWDSVRVLLHDASDGGRELLGALLDHRSCGPYEVRIALDRRPDPLGPGRRRGGLGGRRITPGRARRSRLELLPRPRRMLATLPGRDRRSPRGGAGRRRALLRLLVIWRSRTR